MCYNSRMATKHFDLWIKVKENLHNNAKLPRIREGEIWWCSFGENVGTEINGKNERFTRPVVVFRKHSKYDFVGIPLTSQRHEGSWWVHFVFRNKDEYACINQVRAMSVSRLHAKIGEVSPLDLQKIRDGFLNLYK